MTDSIRHRWTVAAILDLPACHSTTGGRMAQSEAESQPLLWKCPSRLVKFGFLAGKCVPALPNEDAQGSVPPQRWGPRPHSRKQGCVLNQCACTESSHEHQLPRCPQLHVLKILSNEDEHKHERSNKCF